MQIGQLATLTGCSVQAIRYYEKQGLIKPGQRTEGNFRVYDAAAQHQLMFIRRCRSLDISLAEIGQLLVLKQSSSAHCKDANQIIDRHLSQVVQRIEITGNYGDSLLNIPKLIVSPVASRAEKSR